MTWKPAHRMILTIHHNNVDRPIPCVGLPDGYAGRSGISPFDPLSEEAVAEWVRTVERYGAVIVTDNMADRPFNHYVIGIGGGHQDADWCESRFEEGSMVAYYENGESWSDPADNIVRRAIRGDR